MKSLRSATLDGFDAKEVSVEVSLTRGLPNISLVGMASTSVKEAVERIKSALLSNDFKFPPKRVTINLSPSELSKNGSHFDLPIALLIALYDLESDISDWFVFGELGLNGSIKESADIYPLILSLANQNKLQKVIVPQSAVEKLSKIPNITIYGFESLVDVVHAFKENSFIPTHVNNDLNYLHVDIHDTKYYYIEEYVTDFIDVKGQEVAKRAALIAATGFHNILLEGSPGCGKSMIAQRLRYILPPMCLEELLEKVKIEVLSGNEPGFKPLRPFVSPHHSATQASIFGGGSKKARIGEVGLAHLGELFFDELPHFTKNVLEALREPMQDNVIRISRVNNKIEYKSDFLFVGAMNPCPCGNLLDPNKECRCSDLEVQRYRNRLSDPFLDRIDLHVKMQTVSFDDSSSLSSKQMHQKVIEAFVFAKDRGQKVLNANLLEEDIERFCILDQDAVESLKIAIDRFNLSFRSIVSIKKVARTIADLDNSKNITQKHLLEALSYRRRDK
ncbi:MAG: YifB family Mg chelatase-like AAA ATPase [Epsilonproteobacteria bacterium]|nr:YifB family Mg chelatase-like AAA ATPase [Campylobacterota bacterium]